VVPDISVVIPTHDRMDVLPEVLAALEGQASAPEFEVLVVDDGSQEPTKAFLAAWRPRCDHRVLTRPASGPAAARNAGVRAARGTLVAFLGDDTVPRADWLRTHFDAHRRRSGGAVAVIGYTAWHPRMRRTRFLDYINEHGLQFGYALIDDHENVPFNFLYTSNLSLGRDMLLAEPFDEQFPYPAWEDIECSYRLTKRGLRLVYEPAAIVDHLHPTDLARFAVRQEKAGYSAVVFHDRHPDLGPFLGLGPGGPPPLPPPGAQRRRQFLAQALQFLPITLPRLWQETLRYHYIQGLRRGWRERTGERGDAHVHEP
jgi:glycosyltransferase involved in cell wall biosynthesis